MLLQHAIMLMLEFTSIALALALVFLSFKVCNTKRSIFLLGLPLGFFFLMISSIFLELHLIDLSGLSLVDVTALSSSLMWLRVVTQTIGIALITFLYLFASRYQHITKSSYLRIFVGSTVLIIIAFVALYFFKPYGLEAVYTDTNLFSVVNLVLISFIICLLARRIQLASHGVSSLIGTPIAFFSLWFGQLSFLIFAYAGGGTIALITSQIARLVSLALFIWIYYEASKELPTYAGEQAEQS